MWPSTGIGYYADTGHHRHHLQQNTMSAEVVSSVAPHAAVVAAPPTDPTPAPIIFKGSEAVNAKLATIPGTIEFHLCKSPGVREEFLDAASMTAMHCKCLGT